MPQLICYLEGEYPQIFDLVDQKTTIGRGKDNTIRLNDSTVSFVHAEIIKNDRGGFIINDLDSHNGIKINSQSEQSHQLKTGDRIRLGLVRSIFVENEVLAKPEDKEKIDLELQKTKSVLLAPTTQPAAAASEKLDKQIRQQQEQQQKLATEIQQLEKQQRLLNNDLDSTKDQLDQLVNTISQRSEQLEKVDKSIAEKQKEVDAQTKDLEQLSEKAKESQGIIDKATQTLTEFETKYSELNEELELAEHKQRTLNQKSNSLTTLISEKRNLLTRLDSKLSTSNGNAATTLIDTPPLRIIDPTLGSLVHYFHQGAGKPGDTPVLPLGLNSLAACTRGSIHRDHDSVFDGEEPLLVILEGQLENDQRRLTEISSSLPNRQVLATWREGALPKLISQIGSHSVEKAFNTELLKLIHGIISIDRRSAKCVETELRLDKPHLNVYLPCPVEISDWSFALPIANRDRGIFLSADGYDPLSPLHKTRVEFINQLIAKTQPKVTIFQKNNTQSYLPALSIPDNLVTQIDSLDYLAYLELMAQHRLTTGFATNFIGGELMNDSVMTNTLFVGGNAENHLEDHLFPETSLNTHNSSIPKAVAEASRFLSHTEEFRESLIHAKTLATQHISFDTVSDQIADFVNSLS